MRKENYIAVLPHEEIEELKNELGEIKELLYSMREANDKSQADEYVTTKEACRMLHVTDRTLATWRKKGVIQVSQVGRHIYYKMSDIQALIDRNTIFPVTATR